MHEKLVATASDDLGNRRKDPADDLVRFMSFMIPAYLIFLLAIFAALPSLFVLLCRLLGAG